MQRVSLLLGLHPLTALSSDIAERESAARGRDFGVTRSFFVGHVASLPLACAPAARRARRMRQRSRG
jgi:hypothetical protein